MDYPPAHGGGSQLSVIPIQQLTPTVDPTAVCCGSVCLVWPYSSLKQSLSLLLRENDATLGRQRSQVRVTFHGHSAKAVVASRLTVGDDLQLYLTGAEWLSAQTLNSTPGKSVAWDLRFSRRVRLEVGYLA